MVAQSTIPTISDKARAICALDEQRQTLDAEAFELQARLAVIAQKREALTDAINAIWGVGRCI